MGSAALLILVVIAVVVVGAILFVIGLYNGLQRKKLGAENAWSDIDVQLKRRHDLIPNLVNTVKGYATHESETLEAVTSARNAAAGAQGIDAQLGAENMLTQSLGRLFAVSEAYPDLKANQNFIQLQEELTSTENKIGFSRTNYNRMTANYNEKLEMIPTNIVANMFNFQNRDLFEVESAEEREPTQVKF